MRKCLWVVLLVGCGRTVTAPECVPVFRDTVQAGSVMAVVGQCP